MDAGVQKPRNTAPGVEPIRISASFRPLLTLLLCVCAYSSARAQTAAQPSEGRYLFVWAGAVDSTQSDFLAVLDATPGSRYGELVATVPVGGSTKAHHTETELAADGILLANGFGAGTTFRFDLRDPKRPALTGTLGLPEGLAHPHSFVRLPNGHVLATYQYASADHDRPGGLAEHDPQGGVVRWASAADPNIREFYRPYSLVTVPALDRVVTTGVDMHGQALSRVVQVWRLSDLKLLKSIVLPDGARGDEGWQSFEPRLLGDGRTVLVSTLKCGLYRIEGLEGEAPSAALVHTFADSRCDMPAVVGRYWVQTLATGNALAVLDLTDPEHPVEVARLELGPKNRPHWISVEPGGRRLAVTGYDDLRHRVLIVDIDPNTGMLKVDSAFREEGSVEPGISFDRASWPHGKAGAARPHGAVFSRR